MVKKVDCGKVGKEFECQIKELFACKITVAKPNMIDLIKWVDDERVKIEIKTGGTELGKLDENGNIYDTIEKNDYIIYRATISSPIYVMKAKEFWKMVNENNLVRRKFTKAMNDIKREGGEWYYDRITLKTIDDKTSHKQRDFINALLDENAITLDDFIETHKVRVK